MTDKVVQAPTFVHRETGQRVIQTEDGVHRETVAGGAAFKPVWAMNANRIITSGVG